MEGSHQRVQTSKISDSGTHKEWPPRQTLEIIMGHTLDTYEFMSKGKSKLPWFPP